MKMYDAGKVGIGLLIFVGLFLSPFAYNLTVGRGAQALELAQPRGEVCIEDLDYMRAHHMDLLDEWRDQVVRDGNRVKIRGRDGIEYEKSLSKTCLHCHDNQVEFCDKCHDYLSVKLTCWDCHLDSWRGKP